MHSTKTTKFALLDTAIYIENFRSGRFTFRLLQSPFIIRCSSVVLHELLRGVRTATERKFVFELSRQCQVLTPTEQQWLKAAEILNRLKRREHYEAAKVRELAFDVLIALSARSIGASVITTNHADFQAIQREVPFHLLCWD
ncbi:MAG: PIN domain-containing protein [Nitrospira sp. CG24B]|nr:MAG: PIN domain-containing protein [Nitrospira sp. CG24B]